MYGTSSPVGSLKEVLPTKDDGHSYGSLVSLMRKKHPNLKNLDELLTPRLENPAHPENLAHRENSEKNKAQVIEFYDGYATVHPFGSSGDLLEYLNSLGKSSSECNRRLYLLEGLPSNYIKILGSRFEIDPNFFARQVKCGILNIDKDVRDIPLLSSHPTSKESFIAKYYELRDFGNGIHDYELRCEDQFRRISVSKRNGKFDSVGIVRRNVSFWFRKNKENGWNGLILLDPPVGKRFVVGSGTKEELKNSPYRGGYVDFSPPNFDNPTGGPERTRALDDLCYYYTKSNLIQEIDLSSPAAATVVLKRYVASHWMVLLQYSIDLLQKYECTYHRAPRIGHLHSPSIGNCLADVQYLNDRVAGWCENVKLSIIQFKASGTLGNFPKQQENDPDDDDFNQILQQLDGLKQKVQTVISSMSGLLTIVEALRMKELTNLGMFSIPLAFTCGIFSMSGDYAPGRPYFWVYWVIAAPLVLLVFIVAFMLSSGLTHVNSWLLKLGNSFGQRRLSNNSTVESVPKEYSSDSAC